MNDWTPDQARHAAETLLGRKLDANDSTVCPGDGLHSTAHGKHDLRIFLTGKVPYAHCFHTHCYERVMLFNKAIWRRLFGGKRRGVDKAFAQSGLRPVPEVIKKRHAFDRGALEREQFAGLVVTRTWLRERSPVDVAGIAPADYLDALYEPGDRVLCFTTQYSQGDYGYVIGDPDRGAPSQWVELSRSRRRENIRLGTRETPAALRSAREGVWNLCQPVDGRWHLDSRLRDPQTGLPKWSRRSEMAVTAWRWLVVESDDAPVDMWLNFLVQLNLRIAALYTSGGRSVHALVKVNAQSKAQWDAMRDLVRPVLSKLGADPAAMCAVRLSRLPGCLRQGKTRSETRRDSATGKVSDYPVYRRFAKPLLQELLYLNPRPEPVAILNMPPARILQSPGTTI